MTPTQEIWQRVIALAFVFWMERLGELVMPLVPRDGTYFVVATLFNGFMVAWTFLFFRPTPMAKDLQLLLILQGLIQLMGLVLYWDGHLPAFYNTLIHYIVPLTYIRILVGSPPRIDSVFGYVRAAFTFFVRKIERNHFQ